MMNVSRNDRSGVALSPSLLTRSLSAIASKKPDLDALSGGGRFFNSAPTEAAANISLALKEQGGDDAFKFVNPRSLLPRYQAATALMDLARLLPEQEKIALNDEVGTLRGLNAAELRSRAHALSPQLADEHMIVGKHASASMGNLEYHKQQLKATYLQKMKEIESIENSRLI